MLSLRFAQDSAYVGQSLIGDLASLAGPAAATTAPTEQRSRAEIIAQASYDLVAEAGPRDDIKQLLRAA
jgi:hypothetical protein